MGINSLFLLLFVSISCVCAQDISVNSTGSNISDLNKESSLLISDNISGTFSELNILYAETGFNDDSIVTDELNKNYE